MKRKCPKGILILALFTLVASLASITYLLKPDCKLALCNYVLQGAIFRIYYIFIIGLGIAVSIGLFLLKKWAFVIFLIEQVFFLLVAIYNILFTERNALLRAGWKDSEHLLPGYKVLMCVAIFLGIALIVWASCYRKYFIVSKTNT